LHVEAGVLQEMLHGAAGLAEPAFAFRDAHVDREWVAFRDGVAAVLAGVVALPAVGTAFAQAGVFEEMGEGADTELAALLEGDGLLGPGLRVGEGGEQTEDAEGESKVAERTRGGYGSGDAGALAGDVGGEAGFAGEDGRFVPPAFLQLEILVADAQGVELVVVDLLGESVEVGLPLGLLGGSETQEFVVLGIDGHGVIPLLWIVAVGRGIWRPMNVCYRSTFRPPLRGGRVTPLGDQGLRCADPWLPSWAPPGRNRNDEASLQE
jgi:hypothetical protein